MAETQNEQQPHSFKRKLGNTTYTVKVHFSTDTDKTFKDRVQKLIINECLEKIRNLSYQPVPFSCGAFPFAQIYENLIAEYVDLLPIMLYNNDIEFDNTLFSIWRYGYVYGRTPSKNFRYYSKEWQDHHC